MKLLLPDPIQSASQISGSAFLYFYNEQLAFTLQPTASLYLTGIDPFNFYEFIANKKPTWLKNMNAIFNLWIDHRSEIMKISKVLEPLHSDAFINVLFAYPKTNEALADSQNIIESSNLSYNEVIKYINPYAAANELMAHILIEKFFELYHIDKSHQEMFKMGANAAKTGVDKLPENFDFSKLYQYCDSIFSNESIEQLLSKSYLLRLPFLKVNNEFLLSNEKLLEFLNMLPVEVDNNNTRNDNLFLDVISWQVFRQILSKYCDDVNEGTIKTIINLRDKEKEGIEKLKSKCLEIAGDFYGEINVKNLESKISVHVKTKVEKEIRDLLSLSNHDFSEYISSVFSDEKTWIAISAFITSFFTGGPILTASSAIAGLSNLGAKAFKIAAENKKRIKQSDYSIIYQMCKE